MCLIHTRRFFGTKCLNIRCVPPEASAAPRPQDAGAGSTDDTAHLQPASGRVTDAVAGWHMVDVSSVNGVPLLASWVTMGLAVSCWCWLADGLDGLDDGFGCQRLADLIRCVMGCCQPGVPLSVAVERSPSSRPAGRPRDERRLRSDLPQAGCITGGAGWFFLLHPGGLNI